MADRGDEPAMLLSEQIRVALSDEITAGALAPGEQLDEQQIGDRFGASRTPVREALRQMASAGLVEMRPRRGAVVATLTPERIIDMFEASADKFNWQFHEAIYRGTGNAFIAEQAIDLRQRMAAFRRAQLYQGGRPAHSRAEHDGILEAIMRGDGEEAAKRMRAHMFQAAFAMERYVTTGAMGKGTTRITDAD